MMGGLTILMLVALLLLLAAGAALLMHRLTHPPRRTFATQVARDLPTDPGDLGLAFEATTVALSGGRQVELWIVAGGSEAGPTVVMLHGWGDGRLGELAWLEMVRPEAGRVVLFDQRGHGESQGGACQWGPGEAADAVEIISHLAGREPGRPIVLFGYSMGAAVAIEAATRTDLPQLKAIVADSPYRYPRDAVRRFLRMQGLPGWPLLPLAAVAMRMRCPAFADRDTVKQAGQLRQRLLVLHGAEDRVTPLAHASAIANAAARATLEVFADADHLQPATLEPERYRRAVGRCLREAAAQTPATE